MTLNARADDDGAATPADTDGHPETMELAGRTRLAQGDPA